MTWANVAMAPNRWLAAWLRRCGWVVFYLDEPARVCGPHPGLPGEQSGCWLALYRQAVARGDQGQ